MADRLPRLSHGGGRGRPYFAGAGRWAGRFSTRRRSNSACKDTSSRPNLGKNFFFPTFNTLSAFCILQSLYLLLFLATPNQSLPNISKPAGSVFPFMYSFVEEAVKQQNGS